MPSFQDVISTLNHPNIPFLELCLIFIIFLSIKNIRADSYIRHITNMKVFAWMFKIKFFLGFIYSFCFFNLVNFLLTIIALIVTNVFNLKAVDLRPSLGLIYLFSSLSAFLPVYILLQIKHNKLIASEVFKIIKRYLKHFFEFKRGMAAAVIDCFVLLIPVSEICTDYQTMFGVSGVLISWLAFFIFFIIRVVFTIPNIQ